MDILQEARKRINEIDDNLASLFEERMKAVEAVARYKEERGLPIFDPAREAEVLQKTGALIEDDTLRSYFLLFMKDLMTVSKSYQKSLIEGISVAYSGVEGAFAHMAASRLFPEGRLVSYPDFRAAYEAVEKGDCDLCVLPTENSHAGEVGQVMDLTFSGSLFITGVYHLRVRHNLLALPGTKLSDIQTVISHPQALAQCAAYLHDHGLSQKNAVNTAVAAKTVAESGDHTLAAIASKDTAALYGLSILDHDINESGDNTTRFAVFSRVENRARAKKDNIFLLLFTVPNTAGALAKAVNVISAYGFNMRVLRSRPVKNKPFAYYFYVEAEGDAESENGKAMLRALSVTCDSLKVAGRYAPEITLES